MVISLKTCLPSLLFFSMVNMNALTLITKEIFFFNYLKISVFLSGVKTPLNIPVYPLWCEDSNFNLLLGGGLFLESSVLTSLPSAGLTVTAKTRSWTFCFGFETETMIQALFLVVFSLLEFVTRLQIILKLRAPSSVPVA